MQIENLNFSQATRPEHQAILKQIVAESTSVAMLIEKAVYDQHLTLELFQGIDDERPELELLGIKLRFSRTEYGELYLEKSDLVHAKTRDLNSFILGFAPEGDIELDDQAFDLWEHELGFTFNDTLCGSIAPKEALLPYVYTFLCSEGGEVTIHQDPFADEECYQDMRPELEAEGLSRENLLLLSFNYFTREKIGGVTPGFGSCRYIRLN